MFAGAGGEGGGGLVAALGKRALEAEVPGTVVAVGGGGERGVREELLGLELVLDESFTGKVQEGHAGEVAADQHQAVAGFAAAEKREAHGGGVALGGGPGGVVDAGLESFGVEVFEGLELEGMGGPAEEGEGVAVGVGAGVGGDHAGVETVGEDGAVVGAAVVILAGGDVAGAAGEVDGAAVRLGGLAAVAGDPDEVGGDAAVAVVAHGVGGVVVEAGQGAVVGAVESDAAEVGVDRAFGGGADGRIGASAEPDVGDLAVRPHNAAVAGDLRDRGKAEADMGYRDSPIEGGSDASAGAVDQGIVPLGVEDKRFGAGLSEPLVGVVVDEGGVVLVDGVDGDAVGRGSGGVGQGLAPKLVRAIKDSGPVEGGQNDGRAFGLDHEAAEPERIVDGAGRRDPAAAKRMTERRRGVDLEAGEMESEHGATLGRLL